MLEQRGIPTVVMGTYEFEQLAKLESKNRGLAELPLALIPHPLGGIREDDIHLAEDAFASTDLRRHREIVAAADLIVTMTAQQKDTIAAYAEAQGRPVLTLHELAGEAGDVDDPFGQGEDRYRATKDEIKRCLELGVDRMLTLLRDRKGHYQKEVTQ